MRMIMLGLSHYQAGAMGLQLCQGASTLRMSICYLSASASRSPPKDFWAILSLVNTLCMAHLRAYLLAFAVFSILPLDTGCMGMTAVRNR